MKTPAQWLAGLPVRFAHQGKAYYSLTEADIAAIQADAMTDLQQGMQAAMRIIEKVGTTGIEHAYQDAYKWLLRYFPEHL